MMDHSGRPGAALDGHLRDGVRVRHGREQTDADADQGGVRLPEVEADLLPRRAASADGLLEPALQQAHKGAARIRRMS